MGKHLFLKCSGLELSTLPRTGTQNSRFVATSTATPSDRSARDSAASGSRSSMSLFDLRTHIDGQESDGVLKRTISLGAQAIHVAAASP